MTVRFLSFDVPGTVVGLPWFGLFLAFTITRIPEVNMIEFVFVCLFVYCFVLFVYCFISFVNVIVIEQSPVGS